MDCQQLFLGVTCIQFLGMGKLLWSSNDELKVI